MAKVRDFPFATIEIRCDYCGRRGVYSKRRFEELAGSDTALSVALRRISSDCEEERPGPTNMHAPCRPYYTQDWWIGD